MKIANLIVLLITFFVLLGCESDGEEINLPTPLQEIESEISGEILWKKKILKNPIFGRFDIHFDDNFFYYITSEGFLIKGDIRNGQEIWKKEISNSLSAGLGHSFRTLFAASSDGDVFALDDENGELKWQASVNTEVLSSPVANGRIVAVQSVDGRITALDFKTGEFKWEYLAVIPQLTLRGTSEPYFSNNMLFIGFANGNLAMIDPDSGVVRWEIPLTLSEASSEFERIIDVDAKPIVTSGLAIGAAYQGSISAIEIQSSRTVWRQDSSIFQDFISYRGDIFFVDQYDEIFSHRTVDGDLEWKNSELKYRELTKPLRYKNNLVVGDLEGFIHFVDLKTGSLVGRIQPTKNKLVSLFSQDNFLFGVDSKGASFLLSVK